MQEFDELKVSIEIVLRRSRMVEDCLQRAMDAVESMPASTRGRHYLVKQIELARYHNQHDKLERTDLPGMLKSCTRLLGLGG